MANIGDLNIKVDVGLVITDDTANKCIQLLNMWLDDHPNKMIVSQETYTQSSGTQRWLEIQNM